MIDNDHRYNGKQDFSADGLDWYDYGSRWYDASVGRFMGIDPMAEKYAAIAPYAYVANNPLIYIDPDGREIVVPDKTSRAAVLEMINSRAAGTFKFDDNGKLYQFESGSPETCSSYYSDKLVEGINSDNTISVMIEEVISLNGETISVDEVAGGGITGGDGAGTDQTVVVSGNENFDFKNTEGGILDLQAADILLHELVGHAIPKVTKSDTGNAIENQNKAREELPFPHKNDKRAAESDHNE